MTTQPDQSDAPLSDIELEAQLYEQDHRILPVLKRFLQRSTWDKGDPRRRASVIALAYLVLFSPTVVTVGGGTVALLGFVALVYQNYLIREQNMQQQVQIDRQYYSSISQQIWDAHNTLAEATSPSSLKLLALKSLLSHRHSLETSEAHSASMLPLALSPTLNLRDTVMSRVDFSGLVVTDVDWDGSDFTGAKFDDATLSNIYFTRCLIHASLIDVSFSGVSFNFADIQPIHDSDYTEGDATQQAWSGVFQSCTWTSTRLADIAMDNVVFRRCTFVEAQFSNIDFRDVQFEDCDLLDVKFEGCSMTVQTRLVNCRIRGRGEAIEVLQDATVSGGSVESVDEGHDEVLEE